MAKGDCTITKGFMAKPGYGGLKQTFFTATLDNYKTGGYTFDLTKYGIGTLRFVHLPSTVIGHVPEYDVTNKKLLFYVTGAAGPLAELADNNAALATKVVQFAVEGTGA